MTRLIYIVDDDDAFRDSLTFLLQSHGFNCVTYASGDLFLQQNLSELSAPVLLDIRMPGKSGIDVLADALEVNAHLKFIIMSGHADIATAVKAVKMGAFDFLEKPFRDSQVLPLIKEAQTLIDETLSQTHDREKHVSNLSKLTPRETEVLGLVVEGLPNKIIAHNLGLSVRTVETHRAHLMTKLGTKSVPDLVKIFMLSETVETKP